MIPNGNKRSTLPPSLMEGEIISKELLRRNPLDALQISLSNNGIRPFAEQMGNSEELEEPLIFHSQTRKFKLADKRVLDDLDSWKTQVDCSSFLAQESSQPLQNRENLHMLYLVKQVRNTSDRDFSGLRGDGNGNYDKLNEPELNESVLNFIMRGEENNPETVRRRFLTSVRTSAAVVTDKTTKSDAIDENTPSSNNFSRQGYMRLKPFDRSKTEADQMRNNTSQVTTPSRSVRFSDNSKGQEGDISNQETLFTSTSKPRLMPISEEPWKIIRKIQQETNEQLLEKLFMIKVKKRLDKKEKEDAIKNNSSIDNNAAAAAASRRSFTELKTARERLLLSQSEMVREEVRSFQSSVLDSFKSIQEIKRSKARQGKLLGVVIGGQNSHWQEQMVMHSLDREFATQTSLRNSSLAKEYSDLGRQVDKFEEVRLDKLSRLKEYSLAVEKCKQAKEQQRNLWNELMTKLKSQQKQLEISENDCKRAREIIAKKMQAVSVIRIAQKNLPPRLRLSEFEILEKEKEQARKYEAEDKKLKDDFSILDEFLRKHIEAVQTELAKLQVDVENKTLILQNAKRRKVLAKKNLKDFYFSLFRGETNVNAGAEQSDNFPLLPVTKLISYLQGIGEKMDEELFPEYFEKETINFVYELQRLTFNLEGLEEKLKQQLGSIDTSMMATSQKMRNYQSISSISPIRKSFVQQQMSPQKATMNVLQLNSESVVSSNMETYDTDIPRQRVYTGFTPKTTSSLQQTSSDTSSIKGSINNSSIISLQDQIIMISQQVNHCKELELERLARQFSSSFNTSSQRIVNIKKAMMYVYGSIEGSEWNTKFENRRKELLTKQINRKTFSIANIHSGSSNPPMIFNQKPPVTLDEISAIQKKKIVLEKQFKALQDKHKNHTPQEFFKRESIGDSTIFTKTLTARF